MMCVCLPIWFKSMQSSMTTFPLPQSRTLAAVADRSSLDSSSCSSMESIFDDYEMAETSDLQWNPTESVWPHASEWQGPLSHINVIRAREHLPLFAPGSGPASNTENASYSIYQENYTFKDACNLPGGRYLWIYTHSSGMMNLIIRPVPPSPEIHVELKIPNKHEYEARCLDPMRNRDHNGFIITAVAEDDRTIISRFVTRDLPVLDFKRAVKRKCIELGQCTESTDLTMYDEDNVILCDTKILRPGRLHCRRYRLQNHLIYSFPRIAVGDFERPQPDPQPAIDEPQSRTQPAIDEPQSRTQRPPLHRSRGHIDLGQFL